jgi:hypothetical protein
VQAVRALIVLAVFFAFAGAAWAAAPQPTTIVHTPAPVKALAQDGGLLAWLAGNGKKCNEIHLIGGGHNYVLPQPPNASMTCHWAIANGTVHLAIAADALAALWTLHEQRSDFVMTAQVGGKETEVDRLAHPNGTGWWLGGVTGGGGTLAYSAVDVEYMDPLACGSGGSCKKKVAGGGIDLVTAGQKTSLPLAGAALGLAVSGGRIAYIQATRVKNGSPASSPGAAVLVRDASNGTLVSRAKAPGVPIAVGLSSHVLVVLSRTVDSMRLSWYDPATGQKLGGVGVSLLTLPMLAVSDQFVVYRFGHSLRELVLATRHSHPLGKTPLPSVGLSLDQGRLVWAEDHTAYGLIRALPVH